MKHLPQSAIKAIKRLQQIEEKLSLIEFDQKDDELVKIDKKYEYIKQNG